MVKDIIIDVVGSFADGKTTLVKALTSESTLRHSEEKKRGITIRLGYAHLLLYKCKSCGSFSRFEKCEVCGKDGELYSRISIIDSPGHKTLMTIMLSGAPLVDGAVLVIAANQKCPQPQTEEHLEALKIIGVKNIVVAQTKIDVVGKEKAMENYKEIQDFISKKGFSTAKIIPVFAAQNINIVELIQEIGKFSSMENGSNRTKMLVVRSFDINKPGTSVSNIVGGVVGGGLQSGELKLKDKITLYPGIMTKKGWKPLETEVAGIQSEFGKETSVRRGLMIGLETKLDPSLSRRDNLAGSLIVDSQFKPLFNNKLSIEYTPIESKEKEVFKKPLQKNETVLINVLASKVLGIVSSVSGNKVTFNLGDSPVPYFTGDNAIVSRRVENVWILAGSGIIYG
jgi:translation initiation factor 2 subunit 3